jgi:hypothetical protein
MMQPTFGTRFFQNISRLIGWFFGTCWALLAAFSLAHPYARGGCLLATLIALLFLIRLWKHQPQLAAIRPPFKTSVYLVAVAAELIAMYLAALLLPRYGAQQQVYSAIGCIVGLHFIGLWLATRSPRFLFITAGMCIVSLLSMTLPSSWHTLGLRHLLLGAGNAIVLWFAASGRD